MKFLLDENVSPLVEKGLIGHAVIRLPSGTKDRDLISAAQKESAVIVTHDKDFLTLPTSSTEGVILIRIHPPRADEVVASLKMFLAKTYSSSWKNRIVLLEKRGYHIRF